VSMPGMARVPLVTGACPALAQSSGEE
jgi:hypothetical protein